MPDDLYTMTPGWLRWAAVACWVVVGPVLLILWLALVGRYGKGRSSWRRRGG